MQKMKKKKISLRERKERLIDKLNDFFFVLFNFDIIKSERFEQERTINQQNIEIQRLRKKVEQLDAEVIMEMSERSK